MAGLGIAAGYGAGAAADELQKIIAERIAAQKLAFDQEMQRREQDRLAREARQRELEHADALKQLGIVNAREQTKQDLEIQKETLDRLTGKPGVQLSDPTQPFQFGTGIRSALEGVPQPFAFQAKPIAGPMKGVTPESREDLQLADFQKIREVPRGGAITMGGREMYRNEPLEDSNLTPDVISVNGKNIAVLRDDRGNTYDRNIDPVTGRHTRITSGIEPKTETETQKAQRAQGVFDRQLTRLDQLVRPTTDQYQRIKEAEETLGQGTMAADSIAGPKVLTAIIGGFGSGFRMTQSEIDTAAKGNTLWEYWLAKAQRWRLTSDPAQGGFLVPPNQRENFQALLGAMKTVIAKRIRLINDARDSLHDALEAGDTKRMSRIAIDAENRFSGIDEDEGRPAPEPVDREHFQPIGSAGRPAAPPPSSSAPPRSAAPPPRTVTPPATAPGRGNQNQPPSAGRSSRSAITPPPPVTPPPNSIQSGGFRVRGR